MLTIITCFSIKAQTSDIQIKVTSESENEPLFGATVYFEKLEKGAVTDFDGIATFERNSEWRTYYHSFFFRF